MDATDGTQLNRPLFDALARPALGFVKGAGRPAGPSPTTDRLPEGMVLPDGSVVELDLSVNSHSEITAQRPVQKLKASHHEIARLMAIGFKDKEIHEVLGYSLSHLNTLRRSPAFQNLLLYYMSKRDEETISMKARIENLAHRGLDRLGEALDNDEQALSADVLRKITTDLLDRCGHSPINRTQSVSVGLTLDEIKKMKEEIRNGAPTPEASYSEPPVGEVGARAVESDPASRDLGSATGAVLREVFPETPSGEVR